MPEKRTSLKTNTQTEKENEMLLDLLFGILPLVPIINAIIVLYFEAD